MILASSTRLRAPERVPPIGWETRIAPGFDPPIEYFIAYRQWGFETVSSDERRRTVESWGPKALNVLKQLRDDPGWAAYRGDIDLLIPMVKSPNTVDFLRQEAEKILLNPSSEQTELSSALFRFASADYEGFLKLLEAHVSTVARAQQFALVDTLINQLYGEHAADSEARLLKLASSSTDENIKKHIADAIASLKAARRVDEPMQIVLDAERGSDTQP
jgi:hypothetical protein